MELNANKKQAMIRALEKRFGRSIMPYRFEPEAFWSGTERQSDLWRCTDTESGSYIVARTAAWRIYVVRDHDGQATR